MSCGMWDFCLLGEPALWVRRKLHAVLILSCPEPADFMLPTWRRYRCVSRGDLLWVHLLRRCRTVSFSPHLRAPTDRQLLSVRTNTFHTAVMKWHKQLFMRMEPNTPAVSHHTAPTQLTHSLNTTSNFFIRILNKKKIIFTLRMCTPCLSITNNVKIGSGHTCRAHLTWSHSHSSTSCFSVCQLCYVTANQMQPHGIVDQSNRPHRLQWQQAVSWRTEASVSVPVALLSTTSTLTVYHSYLLRHSTFAWPLFCHH